MTRRWLNSVWGGFIARPGQGGKFGLVWVQGDDELGEVRMALDAVEASLGHPQAAAVRWPFMTAPGGYAIRGCRF